MRYNFLAIVMSISFIVIILHIALNCMDISLVDSINAALPINNGQNKFIFKAWDIKYNPSNGNIYVVNTFSGNISVIDNSSNTVKATIPVGDGPQDLKYNPSNGNMYVANTRSNSVSVIDSSSNTVKATVPVGDGPQDLKYNPSNGNTHSTNEFSDTASVIPKAASNRDAIKF